MNHLCLVVIWKKNSGFNLSRQWNINLWTCLGGSNMVTNCVLNESSTTRLILEELWSQIVYAITHQSRLWSFVHNESSHAPRVQDEDIFFTNGVWNDPSVTHLFLWIELWSQFVYKLNCQPLVWSWEKNCNINLYTQWIINLSSAPGRWIFVPNCVNESSINGLILVEEFWLQVVYTINHQPIAWYWVNNFSLNCVHNESSTNCLVLGE